MTFRPKKILLSSVFKPFEVDNEYSRYASMTPTAKIQGVFAPRRYASNAGLHLIANNLESPTVVLDFPTLDGFCKEVRKGYDIIGIGAILCNFAKVKKMVEEARRLSPNSIIVVGGFCARIPDIEKMVEADYFCVGEGISFMRKLLGLPEQYMFRHPRQVFSSTRELMGVPYLNDKTAEIVVSLGCSYGCNFCSTSEFFGKRHIRFYKSGADLFHEMQQKERQFKTNKFTFLSDNFLLDLDLAEELRQTIARNQKMYKIFLFTSADLIQQFGPEKLAELGADTILIGRESLFSTYEKNKNINIKDLVAELRKYGIKTILTSMLLMDHHNKQNIIVDIDDHIQARPVMSHFPHYGPVPGTSLYQQKLEENTLIPDIPYEEWHGFKQILFFHPEFTPREAEEIQMEAYSSEYLRLGPSIMRYIAVEYEGWRNLQKSSNPQLKMRADMFARNMRVYKILLAAMKNLSKEAEIKSKCDDLLKNIETAFNRLTTIDKAASLFLTCTGKYRQKATGLFGHSFEPPAMRTYYRNR